MPEVKQIAVTGLILFSFIMLSLLSSDLADSVFYSFVFVAILYVRIDLKLITVCLVSVFSDIYAQRFVGVSFVPFSVFYIITFKLSPILKNMRIMERIHYFFLILCISEFALFVVTFLTGNKFDLFMHGLQIFYSVVILSCYYMFRAVFNGMKNAG